MQKYNIPALTSLRFFAALAVIVSHLHGMGFVQAQGVHDFLDGGRPAVSFFFVLSGFVLSLRYAPDQLSESYGISRFARIYPVHIFCLMLTVPAVLYIVANQPDRASALFYIKDHVVATLLVSFIAQIFLLTAWTPFAAISQPWNGPSWSLSCEAFFYTCFPWLRRHLTKCRTATLLGILISGWLAQGVWIYIINKYVSAGRGANIIYQFPISHVYEFVAGICCWILYERGILSGVNVYRVPIMLFSLVSIFVLSYMRPIEPAYFLMSPLFVVIIGLVASSQQEIRVLSNKWIVLLGSASYSLYLVHFPVLLLLSIFDIVINPILLVCILVGFSVMLHKLVEEPCRKIILQWHRMRFGLSTVHA